MLYETEFIKMSDPEIPIRTVIVEGSIEKVSATTHVHPEVELLQILEGEMTYCFQSETILLKKGQIIFTNSMVAHSTEIPLYTEAKVFVLQFNPNVLYDKSILTEYKYLLPFINHSNFPYYLFEAEGADYSTELAELFVKIISEFETKEIAYEVSVKAYLYRILVLLYRCSVLKFDSSTSVKKKQEHLRRLQPIFDYVEVHFNENLTVESASRMLNFNYAYFCRLFKQTTDKTFIDYLNFVRVSEAEKLIRTSDKSINQILAETGFSSASYFNRVFKGLKGMSPSAYKKNVRSKS